MFSEVPRTAFPLQLCPAGSRKRSGGWQVWIPSEENLWEVPWPTVTLSLPRGLRLSPLLAPTSTDLPWSLAPLSACASLGEALTSLTPAFSSPALSNLSTASGFNYQAGSPQAARCWLAIEHTGPPPPLGLTATGLLLPSKPVPQKSCHQG